MNYSFLAAPFMFMSALLPYGNHVGVEAILDSHSVKIVSGTGHGSATHIGDGYFITAAHVIQKDITINTQLGREYDVEVMWVNNDYDVALVKSDVGEISTAAIDCRVPARGEDIMLSGSPMNMDFIDTWGRVSGDEMIDQGSWRRSVPVNVVIAPGMSGGGAFDADGDLVGIGVGVMIMHLGSGGGPVGLAYVVPASVVCMLMGRLS